MMTGFEAILQKVPLQSNARVLDVGAGGFAGETTTKFLVNRFDFVVAVERDTEKSIALQKKFKPNELSVLNIHLETFTPLHPYDLMVIDLNEDQIPWIADVVMSMTKSIVTRGGYIIALWNAEDHFDNPGFKSIDYIDKWEGCHLGWLLLQRI